MRNSRSYPAAMIVAVGLSATVWSDALPVEDEQTLVFSKPLQGTFVLRDGQRKRISFRHGAHVAPRLSPDGKTILLHLRKGGAMGLWLTDIDGTKPIRVCDGDRAEWSVDSQRIIFSRQGRTIERELASGIEFQADPGSTRTPVIPANHPRNQIKDHARLSPDGAMLAYQDGTHIYLMNIQPQTVIQLTTAAGIQSSPLWSADGKSITYCQSNDPAGPWDIYNVEIANPSQVRRLERNVHRAIDWNGVLADGGKVNSVKGTSLLAEGRIGLNRRPPVTEPGPVIVLENDWFRATVSQGDNSLRLHPKSANGQFEASISIGRAPSILKSDSQEVVFEVHLTNEQGSPAKATCKMFRAKPYLEITPLNIGDDIFINWETDFVLLPDRFANDIRVSASNCATPEAPLPASPFLLAFPSARDHLLMVVTPTPHQRSRLVVQGKSIVGIKTAAQGESIFLAVLTHETLWQPFGPKTDSQDQGIRARLTFPFSAKWRLSVFGEKNHSVMVDAQSVQLSAIDGFALSDIGRTYPYGRNRNTPLDVITPEDVLRDTVGLEQAARVLDLEGLGNYRTAEPPVPLHQLQSPGAYSSYPNRYSNPQSPQRLSWRKFAHPRGRPFALLLELLGGGQYGGINMAELPGVNAAVDHLCEDIVSVLQGLDHRIREYQLFLADFKANCEPEHNLDGQTGDFLAATLHRVDCLQIKIEQMLPTLKIAAVKEHSQKVKALVGTGGWLGQTTEFERFAETCLTALSQRQNILDEYREFVKAARDQAAAAIPLMPSAQDKAEQIRALTQKVLRNRHYLEGDWRGESIGAEVIQ